MKQAEISVLTAMEPLRDFTIVAMFCVLGTSTALAQTKTADPANAPEPAAGQKKAPAPRNPRYEPEYTARTFQSESGGELKYGWLAPLQVKDQVKYTEYPGVGHDSWTRAYNETDLWPWLFAQKKPSASGK